MKHENLVRKFRQSKSICSDEGLTLETSAFQSLYGGQFTLSTPLINQISSILAQPCMYFIAESNTVAHI